MARNSLKNVCQLIERAKGNLSPEQSFLADLKKSIEMSADSDTRKPSQTYKPSGMTCMRGMYYQLIGEEPEVGTKSYCSVGICNAGSDIHVRVQSYVEDMKKNGFDCEYIDVADFVKSRGLDTYLDIVSKSGMETKLYHRDLNMSFMCDGIIRYNNHYYILELKTEMSMKWNNRTGVDPSHYAQGTAYSIAFNIPEVMFVYISRDVLDMKSYLFVPTDDMKNELIGKIDECDRYVSMHSCPPKPDNVTKKSCSYCIYQAQCRRDGE